MGPVKKKSKNAPPLGTEPTLKKPKSDLAEMPGEIEPLSDNAQASKEELEEVEREDHKFLRNHVAGVLDDVEPLMARMCWLKISAHFKNLMRKFLHEVVNNEGALTEKAAAIMFQLLQEAENIAFTQSFTDDHKILTDEKMGGCILAAAPQGPYTKLMGFAPTGYVFKGFMGITDGTNSAKNIDTWADVFNALESELVSLGSDAFAWNLEEEEEEEEEEEKNDDERRYIEIKAFELGVAFRIKRMNATWNITVGKLTNDPTHEKCDEDFWVITWEEKPSFSYTLDFSKVL